MANLLMRKPGKFALKSNACDNCCPLLPKQTSKGIIKWLKKNVRLAPFGPDTKKIQNPF